ncbi:amidohydrolase family protein [Embleya sp. NPDC056575]|uniref:amidohydrolase family protein n=1 Tax=unclassified Embleya TaxID=2699296 RepID=UPI00368734B6
MGGSSGASGSGRYTVISADGHAGAGMDVYREFLDPAWHEEFDAWRGRYRNPFRDLQGDGRTRNWDDERRIAELAADGIVAEVVFPNTVPPFFPTGQLLARPPSSAHSYARRLAGIRAHNRWLAQWCGGANAVRRAGLAQVFLNDVDDAVAEAVWAKENGLAGILIPTTPPDATGIPPLYAPQWDRLWEVCQDLELAVVNHGGSGSPDYGDYPAATFLWIAEATLFSRRPLTHMLLSGAFARFPRLKFAITEQGAAWVPPLLRQLDAYHAQMASGRIGELKYTEADRLPEPPSVYFARNCWVGASFPSPTEAAARHELGVDRYMWGADYPHDEGTYPYTRESLRRSFHDASPEELRAILAGNAATLYGFDLAALDALAAEVGPTHAEVAEPLATVPEDSNSPAFTRS